MSLVSLINTPTYDEGGIYSAVCRHMEFTGADKDIGPGMKILLKPNLLYGKKPEAAVTTNPAIIAALIRRLRELGADSITVADSSGGLYTKEHMRAVYSACGLTVPGIREYINQDFTFSARPAPEGSPVRSFNLISPVLDADYIINMPKLKTHAMTTVSCGVKNLFGTIPGLQKPDMHCRLPKLEDFVKMLCYLALTVRPDLTILDAVDSMEGNGPGGGDVRHTGCTLASRDVFALDRAAVTFMGLDRGRIPHLAAADSLSLGEAPEMAGDPLIPCSPPFALPDTVSQVSFYGNLPAPLRRPAAWVMEALLRSYPKVDRKKCVGCGRCAESCPQKIISIKDGRASMGKRGCISCFCCQEMCPVHAISVKRGLKNM